MSESEDRTQAPSKLRLQQARERGQVAHSPELTAAAALAAATLLLGVVGEPLIAAMSALFREDWGGDTSAFLDPAAVVDRLRTAAFSVLGPILLLLLGIAATAATVHQAQVGFLFSPASVVPDLSRLWGVGPGRGLGARAGRGAWILGKTIVVVGTATWAIQSKLDRLVDAGGLDLPALGRVWADAVRALSGTLALATLGLGLVDYALQRRRFESMLRLSPEESREDQKATDGDPALRGRRRRIARALRGDAPELLAGATLVVVGSNGMTIVLGGGPPPKRVHVRSGADGPTGRRLRRSAESVRIPLVDHPAIARKLAKIAAKPNGDLTADLVADLRSIWPATADRSD